MDDDRYNFDAPMFVDFTKEEDTNRRLSDYFDTRANIDENEDFSTSQRTHAMVTRSFNVESEPEQETHGVGKKLKTPERASRKAKQGSPLRRLRRSLSHPRLTVPQSPRFMTKSRHRPLHIKSRSEKEKEEVQEIKQRQFKAKPLNRKILHPLKAPMRVPRTPIKAEGFDLETDRRAEEWKKSHPEDSNAVPQFHANPIPKAVLEGPSRPVPVKKLPITIPSSPAFALKQRLRSTLKAPDLLPNEQSGKPVLARPVPQMGMPFTLKFEHKVTEVKPFSFYERDLKKLQDKETKIQHQLEEAHKAFEFHANPIPDLSPVLPAKRVKSPTRPTPFDFESDHRGQVYAEKFQAKLKEEETREKENKKHKARPASVTKKQPFVPAKTNKRPTEAVDFSLATEKRQEQRHEYEQWRTEKEQELATVRKQISARKEQEEKEEIEQQRKDAVHKAQPVRRFKNISVKPSTKPLTKPESPKFSSRPSRRSYQQND